MNLSVVGLSLAGLVALVGRPCAAQSDQYDSGGPLLPEQAAYDVTFYDLSIQVRPSDSTIVGSLTAAVRVTAPLEWFVLDLDPRLAVTAATAVAGGSGDRRLDYDRRGGKIWIKLPGRASPDTLLVVRVGYGGRPRVAPNAPWDGGFTWAETPGGQPWIATTCQQQGPDVWWPAKDHPSDKPDSMALHVTVPKPLVVAANGEPRGVTSVDEQTWTYDWFVSTPISAYNVALNIAPYREITQSYESTAGASFPVSFWVLPESYEQGQRLFPEILSHLRFYERLLGPYPFRADKYGVAQTPHLGMEHQTIIAYGAGFDNGAMTGGVDWGFDALHHHELAHEWWGNLVTNADWSDMWIHEGFGTYMQPLYLEETRGASAYRDYMMSIRRRMGNRVPVAPRETRSAREIYTGDIYFKGAWILHTLRYLVGDTAFKQLLRRMAYPDPALEAVTDGAQVRFAATDDFLALAERVTARELDWFVDVYLRQPRLPRLAVRRNGTVLELEWQTPTGDPFPLPVDVQLGEEIVRVDMTEGRGSIDLRDPDTVAVIDPHHWLLMDLAEPRE